jgi:hypothetical protein
VAQHRIPGTQSPLTYMRTDPELDPLRADPRYADLVHKIGFPQ